MPFSPMEKGVHLSKLVCRLRWFGAWFQNLLEDYFFLLLDKLPKLFIFLNRLGEFFFFNFCQFKVAFGRKQRKLKRLVGNDNNGTNQRQTLCLQSVTNCTSAVDSYKSLKGKLHLHVHMYLQLLSYANKNNKHLFSTFPPLFAWRG